VLRKASRLGDDDPDDAVWQRLTRTTLDGVGVTPLGTPALLEGVSTSGRPTRTGDWDIRAHLTVSDPAVANEEALVDLEGGVTSLWLTLADGVDLERTLQGVFLDLAGVVLDAPDPLAVATTYLGLLDGATPGPGTNLGVDGEAEEEVLVAVARLALEHGVPGVVLDGTAVHDRGASDGQELGHVAAVGVRVLRVLTAAGMSIDEAAGLVELRIAATDEQLPTIAKLRAARRIWDRVLEVSGAQVRGHRQHAVTSGAMMSRYDPYVNMLRATVAAFGAGVGGAEAVTVQAFDTPLGRPSTLGRRVARNTSALLISESHLARVADPAGGSYAVEALTDDLAAVGWAWLGRLDDGEPLDEAIEQVVAERERQVATRRRALTGLSEFPAAGEVLPEREPDPLARVVRRWGASWEALRDEPAAAPVFLATLGSVAAHTARATFATNLLVAGGITVEPAGPTEGVADLVAAHAGQPVVCLAGTDAAYAEWGAEAAAALREAGARRVLVAGRPVDWADDAAAVGDDALAFLTRTREALA
jgi:methylmalonyl-CoA mutase